MKRAIVALIILISVISFAGNKNAEKLIWHPFGDAKILSKENNKPLMVVVVSASCGWCKKYLSTTLADNEVDAQLDKYFVVSKVNVSSMNKIEVDGKEYTERQIGSMFAVRGVPATIFISPSDTIIAKLPGYIPTDKFKTIIQYLGEGWYKDMTYQEFIESDNKINK
ncbi:thioredoxin fold domain-containing protein [bacterium]|nr:thioredoxin fold domain-containing protein [bacterium]